MQGQKLKFFPPPYIASTKLQNEIDNAKVTIDVDSLDSLELVVLQQLVASIELLLADHLLAIDNLTTITSQLTELIATAEQQIIDLPARDSSALQALIDEKKSPCTTLR